MVILMRKIILLIFTLLIVSGCVPTYQRPVYQSQTLEPVKQVKETSYNTFTNELFTVTYTDEWTEPKHYTEDYYFFQLLEIYPNLLHLMVTDIEEFESMPDYYESMSELFYIIFDFQEIDHQVTEDEMTVRGTMVDEEGDEIIVSYKAIVCSGVPLIMQVSTFSEDYVEIKGEIDKTVDSFRCVR
jgi:hypothetical protein